MVEEKYYALKEVASLLKVTYMTVFRWVKTGKIEAYKVGKQFRIKQEDIKKFIIFYKNK